MFSYVIFFTDLLCFSVVGGGVLKPAVSFDLTDLARSYSNSVCNLGVNLLRYEIQLF